MAAWQNGLTTNDNSLALAFALRGDNEKSSLLVAEPTGFERKRFSKILATVSAAKGIHLPSFLTARSDCLWRGMYVSPLLKEAQPGTNNMLGVLRMRGAVSGWAGDLDLCKLWVAVARAGGVKKINSPDLWRTIATQVSLQLSSWIPLSQIYILLLCPVEDCIEAQRTKLAALGQKLPSGLNLLYLNWDFLGGFANIPAPINNTQQHPQKKNWQSSAPQAINAGTEKHVYSNQAIPEHGMNASKAKRKRDDAPDGQNKRITPYPLANVTHSQQMLDNRFNSPHLGYPGSSSKKDSEFIPQADSVELNMVPVVIGGTMSAASVVEHLIKHRCPEVTDLLDLQKCGNAPTFGGGFGDVYHGHLRDGRQVAIKCARVFVGSHDESHKMLKRSAHELYVWSKCKHANVIELLGLAQFRNQIAMVSPWMENGGLPDYLARNRSVDRCRLCVQVTEGLNYLHGIGMIHGDVKAANVIVSTSGTAKLADFGNTILQEYTLKFAPTTRKNNISLRWTAPELLSDNPSGVSKESDVYALGMTILEIITGKVPFAAKSERAVMAAVVLKNETPQRPDEFIPTQSRQGDILWALLGRCWMANPTARPKGPEVEDAIKTITSVGLINPTGTLERIRPTFLR